MESVNERAAAKERMDAVNMLFYTKPAGYYMEALPLGNGSLGAMCNSGVSREEIQLNHDTLWTGRPGEVKSGRYESYLKAQQLALQGKYKEAHEELSADFLMYCDQTKKGPGIYQTFGSLNLKFPFAEYSDYRRTLDMSDGVLHSSFVSGNETYVKTTFVSHPGKAVVYRIEALNKSRFSFEAELSCPLKNTTYIQDNTLITDGECYGYDDYEFIPEDGITPDQARGVLFRGALNVDCDGTVTAGDNRLQISDVTYAVLYFSIESSYNGYDKYPAIEGKEYKNACLSYIEAARTMDYEALLAEHIADHSAYYDRVWLKLEAHKETVLPTDERLKLFETDRSDLSLYALLFNFGRYLLIASSRAGSRATNLQGIWNQDVKAKWGGCYIYNINTQMNYWPVLPCNMPELMEPLVQLVKDLSVAGEHTARGIFHARGFVVNHGGDIWGHTAQCGYDPRHGYFPTGSGWLCQNLYQIYAYTQDKTYLAETIFPIMKKAAEFYLDVLVEDTDHTLILCPAASPENGFYCDDMRIEVSKSSAMMNSIVRDLFGNCKKACEDLGIRDSFYEEVCQAWKRIKPLQIGADGTILEFDEPVKEYWPDHRHISHLYALYPAGEITQKDTELFEACKKSLLGRGEKRGMDQAGWSMAWKVSCWARLKDGNRAQNMLNLLLNPVDGSLDSFDYVGDENGVFPNMFLSCPPFQIDASYGVVAGICEMLLQSDEDNIYLLPALPDDWKDGSVKGLAARGNVTVDIEWKAGKVTDYTIHGQLGNRNVVLN